ncbi:MAG TPA: hypothetical protein VJ742_12795 [Nitrososphaera sp.]|nr:hypothetical protein [Nitrososphaera sp.]
MSIPAETRWHVQRLVDEYKRLESYGYTEEEIEPWLRSAFRDVATPEDVEEAIKQRNEQPS